MSSVTLPVNEHSKHLLVNANSFYVGKITFQVLICFFFAVFFFWGGEAMEECRICLIVLVVKLPTGFEASVHP